MSLDLAKAAPIYKDIVRAADDDPDVRRLLEGIRSLGAKVLYPALLAGYAALGEEGIKDKLAALANALTVTFVRHSVIGGRESTVMESTIYQVAAELRKSKDFDAAVAALASFAPTGEDFIARFQRAPVSRIATARYLLREIEHAMRSTHEVAVEGTSRVHVEHIYPQTPAAERWANHYQVVNRLGNMTLLARSLNTSIKNGDFATKKEKGYAKSDILMTKQLLERSEWDAAAIDERQRDLSAWAFDCWKFPDESPPAGLAAQPTEREKSKETYAAELEYLPEVPT